MMQTRFVKKQGRIFLTTVVVAAVVTVMLAFTGWSDVSAQMRMDDRAGRFAIGGALGLQADTLDGKAFALGLYGDYYLDRHLSFGPLLQIGLTGDLRQIGLSAQAKYTVDVPSVPQFKPHFQAGLGFIHADLERSGLGNERDTSFLIPFGVGAEYQLTGPVSLDTSLLFNFTNLDIRDENFFFTWLVGIKYMF